MPFATSVSVSDAFGTAPALASLTNTFKVAVAVCAPKYADMLSNTRNAKTSSRIIWSPPPNYLPASRFAYYGKRWVTAGGSSRLSERLPQCNTHLRGCTVCRLTERFLSEGVRDHRVIRGSLEFRGAIR